MIKLVAETSLLTRGPNTASERVNIFLQVRNDQRKDVGHNPLIHHQGHTTSDRQSTFQISKTKQFYIIWFNCE